MFIYYQINITMGNKPLKYVNEKQIVGGSTYTGFTKNKKMHGNGIYTWPDNNCYKGDFVNGKQHGYGIFKWQSGGVYKGYWVNDTMDGFGWYRSNGGNTYCGTWSNDKKISHGIVTYSLKINKETNWKMIPEKIFHKFLGTNGKLVRLTPYFNSSSTFSPSGFV